MDRVEKKIFLYISVLFLSAIFIVSFLPDFIKYINGERTLYGYYSKSYFFLNKMSPRSSGLSRTILFLLILINVFFNQKTNLRKYFFIFFKILCISIIIILQSRAIIFLAFLYLIFDFLSKKNYSPKILISEVVSFIIIPIMIVILLNNLSFYFEQKKISKLEDPSIKYWSSKSFSGSFKEKKRPIENFSSGRFEDWKQILDKVDKRFIIGFGAQGDRFLINQTASNGILYALTSSGFIGLFFFLFFTLKIFFIALKNIFLAIFFEKNEIFFNFLIIIILMRSVLESSYAVFGIDLIILMTIINYISKAKNN
jgi:O-antigen ligase